MSTWLRATTISDATEVQEPVEHECEACAATLAPGDRAYASDEGDLYCAACGDEELAAAAADEASRG